MVAAPIADELQRGPSTRATMRIASNRETRYEEIVFVLILCGCGGLTTRIGGKGTGDGNFYPDCGAPLGV